VQEGAVRGVSPVKGQSCIRLDGLEHNALQNTMRRAADSRQRKTARDQKERAEKKIQEPIA
jgi:hypothetical protein